MSGVFAEDSMIRRVHREHVLALSGPRALLMQAAHPVAFAGFFMSTGALGDPYRRLRRTAEVLDTAVWGERSAAEAATARVRRVHSRVRGVLPDPVGRFPAGLSQSTTKSAAAPASSRVADRQCRPQVGGRSRYAA